MLGVIAQPQTQGNAAPSGGGRPSGPGEPAPALALAGPAVAMLVVWWALASFPLARGVYCDAAVAAGAILSFLLLTRAALVHRRRGSPAGAYAWIAAGLFCFSVAEVVWAYLQHVVGIDPYPSVADYFYLAAYPLLLVGILRLPERPPDRESLGKLLVDVTICATACSALFLAYWHAWGKPAPSTSSIDLVLSWFYTFGDMALLVALFALVLQREAVSGLRGVGLFAAGMAATLVADLAYGVLDALDTYEPGHWVGMLWAVGYFGLAAAGAEWCRPGPAGERAEGPRACDGLEVLRLGTLNLLVLAAWGALVYSSGLPVSAVRSMQCLLLGTVALVVLRQTAERLESLALNRRLRLEVAERVRAEEALQAARLNLEQRVADRTAALAAANAALREQEAGYRELVENTDDIVLRFDREGRALYVSPVLGRVTGASPGAGGRRVGPDLPAEVLAGYGGWVAEVASSGKATAREVTADLRIGRRTYDVRTFPEFGSDGQVRSVLLSARDITALRAASDTLRHRLRYEQALARCARELLEPTAERDPVTAVLAELLAAAGASRVYQFTNEAGPAEALCASLVREVCAPGVAAQIDSPALQHVPYDATGFRRWREELSAGHPILGRVAEFPACERAFLRGFGTQAMLVLPVFVEGDWVGFIGFDHPRAERGWAAEDVELLATAIQILQAYLSRQRSEEALARSERQFRTLIESQGEGCSLIDLGERFVFANPAAHAIFGMPPGELPGWSLLEFCDPEALDTIEEQVERRRSGETSRYTLRIRRPDGERRVILATVSPHYNEHGALDGAFGVYADITDLKEAQDALEERERALRAANARLEEALRELESTQQQVIQQERLSALGTLASGIAHDFNNALAPIVGFAELLLIKSRAGSPLPDLEESLEIIRTAALDGAAVVRRLREFYRTHDEAEALSPIDVESLVRSAVALTQPRWKDEAQAAGKTIQLALDLQPMPRVYGVETDLREALVNLVINAADALCGDRRPGHASTIGLSTEVADGHLLITVSDTGPGMTAAMQRRCLEPFFTTKGERGTGLGLAMVYGIVRRHGGEVRIQSAPGVGTAVSLVLPLTRPEPADQPVAQPSRALARTLRVLVAEDDPAVRRLLAAYLTADGHHVDLAANGRDAVERFDPAVHDALLTDQAMPEMNGADLVKLLKAQRPDLGVIMQTGFGDQMRTAGTLPEGVDVLLAKPITLTDLRAALHAIAPRTNGHSA
ncbi:MAG: PAS domain S-box protein [Armatimonadetes bacterium]|nr:PAS domain S-box protein [Armatimonadota bacterium]